MCGISAIYILDKKGRVLISRAFRTDIPSNIQDIFNKKILEYDDYTIKYGMLNADPSFSTRRTTFSSSIGT
jgi:AP-1 complex subunit mu